MKYLSQPSIAVVIKETQLQKLKGRWSTTAAATFRLRAAAQQEVERRAHQDHSRDNLLSLEKVQQAVEHLADEQELEREQQSRESCLERLMHEIDIGYPIVTVDQQYLATFDFSRCLIIFVVGPDGLVANTAKYAGDVPIIGVNPDPQRYDGILTSHSVQQSRRVLQRAIEGRAPLASVTLAEVSTNDGQRMLAFNDFFVGAQSHVSARYVVEVDGQQERQSSSGILVSTGAGSTGWLSSLYNMVKGFHGESAGTSVELPSMDWTDRRLVWAVREPFVSRNTSAEQVLGWLDEDDELVVASQMPQKGVIFSDGIESDHLEFTTGTIARFRVARQCARLVLAG